VVVEVPRRSRGENKPSWPVVGLLLVFPSEAFVKIISRLHMGRRSRCVDGREVWVPLLRSSGRM
jgi:hypothetical protein